MPAPVRMPKFGLAMTEGKVLRWLATDGECVDKGQYIAEIETAKAVNQLEAPSAGTLARIILQEGQTAPVAQTIAWLLTDGETAHSIPRDAPDASPEPEMTHAPGSRASTPASGVASSGDARPPSSPAARRLAAQLGVDLALLIGSGPDGAIIKQDVLAAAQQETDTDTAGDAVPLSPIRKEIVSTVTASAAIPQIVLFSRVDATALRTVRRFDDAIIFCVARALASNAYLNASFQDDHIRLYDEVNVGFPVSVEQGLVIPVIRQADTLTLAQIGDERKRLVDSVRSRKITTAEISGATFTVSNLSMYPVDRFKALISPPQAAILTVGRIRKQPVAVGSDVLVRPTIEFGLTVDHRVADGVTAALFLKDFVSRIESIKSEDMQ